MTRKLVEAAQVFAVGFTLTMILGLVFLAAQS